VFAQNDTTNVAETPKDTAWTFEGQSSFNFTQGYLDNWSQGGENFLSTLLLNDYSIIWEKEKASWENTFNYKLGGTQQGEKDIKKTEDIFEFNSKFGYEISQKKLFFSNVLNFKTQFLKGFDFVDDTTKIRVSQFLNPGYLVLATGFEYKYKKMLSALVSPVSGKATITTDTTYSTTYGLEAGENFRAEMGAYIKIQFKKDIMKNVKLNTSLELFNNYFDKPENIDVDWQTTFTFNINKYLKAVLFAHLMYDHDVIQKLQVKETLGIGISYAINSREKK
jgi:hypothetical protein